LERKRIQDNKGIVILSGAGSYRVIPDPSDADLMNHRGGGQNLSLNMSRALGHKILSKYGVTSEPTVYTWPLFYGDKLVIGCDGLWDVLPKDEVAKIINSINDPVRASKHLLKEAEERWATLKKKSDNITIICVYIIR